MTNISKRNCIKWSTWGDSDNSLDPNLWYVGIHGGVFECEDPDGDALVSELELFICKGANNHGFTSYGWGGWDKIILFDDLNPEITTFDELNRLVNTATKMVMGLNEGICTPIILGQYAEDEERESEDDYA